MLWPWLGIMADALWLAVPLYFKKQTWRGQPLYLWLTGSLLIDLMVWPTWPVYTATTLLAWYIYSEFIEPRLLFMTQWNRLLAVAVWLLLWRLLRWLWLVLLWLVKILPAAPREANLSSWLIWLAGGAAVWLLAEGLNKLKTFLN